MANKTGMVGTCSLLLFVLLLLSGCAEGPPSEEMMKKDLAESGMNCGLISYTFPSPGAISQFKIEQKDERDAFADYTVSFKFSIPSDWTMAAKVHLAYWRRENHWVLDKVECLGDPIHQR